MCVCSVMSDSVTPWSVAYQIPLSMEFSRQEYWDGLRFLLQGIFPTLGSSLYLLGILHWQVDSLPLHHLGNPRLSYGAPTKEPQILNDVTQ